MSRVNVTVSKFSIKAVILFLAAFLNFSSYGWASEKAVSPTQTTTTDNLPQAITSPDQLTTPTVEADFADGAAEGSLVRALRQVRVSGSLDAYYTYNFNRPPAPSAVPVGYGSAPTDQNVYVVPNNYHDQVTLNFAELKLSRVANPAGFHLDLGFGPWADAISGNNNILNVSDSGTRFLMQAYIEYKFNFGLDVEVGKFFSDMGFESDEPSQNWNYSMSIMSREILPYWHTGVRLAMPFGRGVDIVGYVSNGPNTFYDNSGSKTYGLQAKFVLSDELTFVANWLTGVQASIKGDLIAGTPLYAGADAARNIYEGTVILHLLEPLKIVLDCVMANEKFATSSLLQTTSVALYANYNFAPKFYLLPRYEIFNDGGTSFSTGQMQTINAATLGVAYRATDDLRIQAEYRIDASVGVPYTNPAGQARHRA